MKIILIAISGVRVMNPRLNELGITMPGFVERAETIASMPSLGLLTIAALTPKHHEISYLEMSEFDSEMVANIDADLVAISSFTAKASIMYRLADSLRERGIKVVLGGLHVSLIPEEAQEHADAILVGEGEDLWSLIVKDIEKEELKKRYENSSRSIVKLGSNPAPRFDLLDKELYNRIPIQTTRGCPLHCEFCAASRNFSNFKKKDLDLVRRDIRAAKDHFDHVFIELADDNTFVDKVWSKELVKVLRDEKVAWFTETDISIADDPELLELLAESGCRQILIGFESPDALALDGIDRGNWKAKKSKYYLEAIDRIQSYGISVNGTFVLGLDNQTPNIFKELEKFIRKSKLTEVQITVLTPFPGTKLYERLKEEGRLLKEKYWDHCTLFDVNFKPKHMSVDELEKGLEYLMTTLYSEEATKRRKDIYRSYLKQYRKTKRQRKAA